MGIEFNRWSEDPHRGELHASIADWIPDTPRLPFDTSLQSEWYAAQDAYVADPTDENFINMLYKLKELTFHTREEDEPFEVFKHKYASVQIAQHYFRHDALAKMNQPAVPFLERPILGPLFPREKKVRQQDPDLILTNPWWEVGSFLRSGSPLLPDDILERVDPESSNPKAVARREYDKIRVPWFYLGLTYDQSMQHTGSTLEYYSRHIHRDFHSDGAPKGLTLHYIFSHLRNEVVNFEQGELDNFIPKRLDGLWGLIEKDNLAGLDPVYREGYVRMRENQARMVLFLAWNKVKNTGESLDINKKPFPRVLEFFEGIQSEHYDFNMKLYNDFVAFNDGTDLPIPTSTDDALNAETPDAFSIEGNYPNPFNPTTTIVYSVGQAGPVNLAVFDLVGREIAVLVDEVQAPGRYDARFDAAGLPGGVYLYRLTAGGVTFTDKMVLVK